jgi:MFS family permease
MITLGLFAGVVSDRVPKRNLLIATQSTLGISALITAVLINVGIIELWHLIGVGVIQGIAFAFNVPTRQAIVPEVVSKEKLSNGVALINAGASLSNISGPPIAGLIIGVPWLGITGALYLGAFMYFLVLLMLLRLPKTVSRPPDGRGFKSDLTSGVTYVISSPILPVLLLMQLVPLVIAMPYQQSMPVFAAQMFDVGAQGLGILLGAVGFGALVGALFVASIASTQWKQRTQLIAGTAFCVALFLFGQTSEVWMAIPLLLITGASTNAYQALNLTSILEATEPAYYGRVMSVASIVGSFGPLSVLPYGFVLDHIGPRITTSGSAMIVALFLTGVALLRPAFRGPDSHRVPAIQEQPSGTPA